MSHKTTRLAAAVLTTITLVAAPATTGALAGGKGIPLACQGSGGGCLG